eukprot:scaffold87671_cov33-Phaeocystis_antarctica.AAC.1
MAVARHSSSVQLSKVSKVAASANWQHPLYLAALNSRTTLLSKRASTPPRKWPRASSSSEDKRWTVVPTTRRRPPETKKPPAISFEWRSTTAAQSRSSPPVSLNVERPRPAGGAREPPAV